MVTKKPLNGRLWCNRQAALRCPRKAVCRHGVPEKITIHRSGANTAAIVTYNTDHDTDVEIRQVKYLNNIVEQAHRVIKRMVRAMLEFTAFWSTAITIAGIEVMPMIRKGQLQSTGNCVRRSSSIRWQHRPVQSSGPDSAT